MGTGYLKEILEDWKPEDEDTDLSAEDERLIQEIIDCLTR